MIYFIENGEIVVVAVAHHSRRPELEGADVTANNALQRTSGHRGRPVLAMNRALGRAESARAKPLS